MLPARNIFRFIGLLACYTLLTAQSQAATYIALLSGNYTNPATWGIAAPPLVDTADNIIIPPGITVTLDQSVEIKKNGTLSVNGTLTTQPGKYLSINIASGFNGFGTINADSMFVSLFSFTYTGTINAASLQAEVTTTQPVTINVAKQLTISGGGLYIDGNAVLNLAAGGIMVMAGGMLPGIGTMNLTQPYNVIYKSSGVVGAELDGTGLKNITIDLSSGNVSLQKDFTIFDTLTINGGNLAMGSHNLSLADSAWLTGSKPGNITGIHGLTINLADSSLRIDLGADMAVDTLYLQKGILNAGNHKLTVAGAAKGGGPASFVRTDTGGWLRLQAPAGTPCVFPVGASGYAAVAVTINSGPGTYMDVNVSNGVFAFGKGSSNLANTRSVVNATWRVNSISGLALTVMPMWGTDMEVNGFNRNAAYVGVFTGNRWDTIGVSAATSLPNNTFGISRSNIASNSIVAVMDTSAHPNHIAGMPAHASVSIYPNPANEVLHVGGITVQQAAIFSITGQLVKTVNTAGNTIVIDDLPPGSYIIRLHTDEGDVHARFGKQ